MFHHVMVPLDGSPLAEQALPFALQLIPPEGKLTLIMALELPAFYPLISPSPPIFPAEREDYHAHRQKIVVRSEEYLHKLIQNYPDRSIEWRIVEAHQAHSPAAVIVDTAAELGVDAITMSTHGRSGFSRWLLGSVTLKVLEAAPCPVFVVPGKLSV
jgi:nucleotide-binding universal stress UspA family protein